MNKTYKYHYFYKITNLINDHFYYGVHNTDNLNDGYMGSGKRLALAYKKYGIENFKKEILKFFNTKEDAFEYESEIVNEYLVNINECYNLTNGGSPSVWGKNSKNTISVIDINTGNKLRCKRDDPKYLSKQYIPITTGYVTGIDKNGKTFYVKKDDIRFSTGELLHIHEGKGRINVNGKSKYVDKDSDEYKKFPKFDMNKSKIPVKTKNGNNIFFVEKDDPRYLSGELIFMWVGKKHSEETKLKMKKYKQENHPQLGEKNSQYGKVWIYNENEKISKSIKKELLNDYIKLGWKKGRKIKFPT